MFIGKSNNISFKVSVVGTNVEPKVRVVLCTNPELSWAAVQKQDESWNATLDIPDNITEGHYNLRVDVVIRDKLFSPIQKKVFLEHANKVEITDFTISEQKKVIEAPLQEKTSLLDTIMNIKIEEPKKVEIPIIEKMEISTDLCGLEQMATKKKYKVSQMFEDKPIVETKTFCLSQIAK